jgi:Domain of unknown function (DUF5076)
MSDKPAKRTAAEFQPLAVPPQALEQGGYEVLRAVICDGQLHVSLRRAFDEPETWGILLADITRHIGRIFAREASAREDRVVEKVWGMYDTEMERPTEIGETNSIS